MRITADDGGAGLGEALFGPDYMHNTLTQIVHRVIANAEFLAVLREGFHLYARGFILDDTLLSLRRGWHVVVWHGQCGIRPANLASSDAKPFKSLRAGHFMNEVAVDVYEASAIILRMDEVAFPDFIVESFCHWSVSSL